MSLLNKVKNLFRGSTIDQNNKSLPAIVQVNVNPKEHWDIIGELGDGAFGKVEKAVSRTNPSQYAASKAIEVQQGEELEDFLVEIEILTSCKHQNIVGLFACYFHDNVLHMLLEYCGGGAVDVIMQDLEKPLTEKQIAYITKYTCEALKFLHASNVIHRDLKASNVLLTQDGIVKLADFGVSAKLRDANEKRDTFIGTPYWMAPEVMMCETFKDEPYNSKSDIWSFGITLIEMAQMEPPHSNLSPMRVLIKVQKSDPPTLLKPSSWSIFFVDFLKQCLSKSPQIRKNAAELATHPFIREEVERKPILELLAEVSAEVHEEVIVEPDDRLSFDGGSLADSEEQNKPNAADIWDSKSSSRPQSAEVFPVLETPKKRAAPPPPVETPQVVVSHVTNGSTNSPGQISVESQGRQTSRVSQVEITYSSSSQPQHAEASSSRPVSRASATASPVQLQLTVSGARDSRTQSPDELVSPRLEALNILDDLNITLEGEQYEDRKVSSRLSENDAVTGFRDVSASNSPNKFSENGSKERVSHDNHHSPISSSTNLGESVYFDFRRKEMHFSANDNVQKTRVQRTFQDAIAAPRQSSTEKVEELASKRSSVLATNEICEGHVQSKIREVIQEQENDQRNEAAQKLAQERRDAEATFTREPVADLTAKISMAMPNKAKTSAAYRATPRNPEPLFEEEVSPPEGVEIAPGVRYFDCMPPKKAPPPEPPVDYDKNAKENISRLGARRDVNRLTVTKKTRTYMIDGVQVTSTTVHVLGAKDDKAYRKQQLHDLRRIQRDEARQKQELSVQREKYVEEQTRQFAMEQSGLARQFEYDMENLERRQRKEIEDAEAAQENELKSAQRRLRMEQDKDMKSFRDRLKQEVKIMKQEMGMLSRSQRKDATKMRKDQIEQENQLKEAEFQIQIQQNTDSTMQRMAEKHKERMALLEKQFLMQKHTLLRAKENNIWELEDKQMREKYVLHRKLLKDEYFLLRSQMLNRHTREMSQLDKMSQTEEDDLIRALALDRKKLPKVLRQEAKTRSIMFKESLRISSQSMSNAEMNDRIRRFDEQESLRIKAALEEHDQKTQRKLAALKERQSAAISELEEMQNEKRKQLLEKETNTMLEHERKYYEMRDFWQEDLTPRKVYLEYQFQEQLDKQQEFYGLPPMTSAASTLSARHIP